MTKIVTKKLRSNKLLLKSSALIIGFFCWSELVQFRKQQSLATVPATAAHATLPEHNLFLPEPMDVLHCNMYTKNLEISSQKMQEQKNNESYES